MDRILPGMPPRSDTATLALLGYGDLRVYSGRGACAKSSLDRVKEMDLMPILMNLIGKTKKFGA